MYERAGGLYVGVGSFSGSTFGLLCLFYTDNKAFPLFVFAQPPQWLLSCLLWQQYLLQAIVGFLPIDFLVGIIFYCSLFDPRTMGLLTS